MTFPSYRHEVIIFRFPYIVGLFFCLSELMYARVLWVHQYEGWNMSFTNYRREIMHIYSRCLQAQCFFLCFWINVSFSAIYGRTSVKAETWHASILNVNLYIFLFSLSFRHIFRFPHWINLFRYYRSTHINWSHVICLLQTLNKVYSVLVFLNSAYFLLSTYIFRFSLSPRPIFYGNRLPGVNILSHALPCVRNILFLSHRPIFKDSK